MFPFKSYLMHVPLIPNFYIANLESDTFLDNFDRPVGPLDCVKSKSCIRQNDVPFKSCFMHYPQIPNLYFVNLESGPFFEAFARARRASGVRQIKKLNKKKCS